MRTEKPIEIKQRSSERKVITEDLEDLQKDMAELNKVMNMIKRCSVKEVILSEINLISAKIDSLKDLIIVNVDNAIPGSDVVTGRRRASYRLQKKPYQTLVINNRYDLLSPNERHGSETGTSRAVQQLKTGDDYNKKTSNKKQNKIIILGDSHVRGCAQEVQHNLGHNFEVQGIVKPGANTEIIVNTSPKITGTLTKKEVVVVWGGTHDVGRNETKKGLLQTKNFVSNHNQTNVIVMSVPCRYDLHPKSCVNDEVKVYNRKLKKHLKIIHVS